MECSKHPDLLMDPLTFDVKIVCIDNMFVNKLMTLMYLMLIKST